jgi:hypothetical protein
LCRNGHRPEISAVPISYSVDRRLKRVRATGSGTIHVSDFAEYISARVRDGVYDYDQVIDLSAAHFDVAVHEVIQVIKQARVHLAGTSIPLTALVAHQGSLTYGLARQLAMLFEFEGATVNVAETVRAADEWIDHKRADPRASRSGDDDKTT